MRDAVVDCAGELWQITQPKYPDGGRVANGISTRVKTEYEKMWKAKIASTDAVRAAASILGAPPGLPTPQERQGLVQGKRAEAGQPSDLVQTLLSRAKETEGGGPNEDQSKLAAAGMQGNEQGAVEKRVPSVPAALQRAAMRLANPGPPDLRVERLGDQLALHLLQEKWTFSDWVDGQGLHGAQLREARTHARVLELGCLDFGVAYLMSRPAEVTLRRLLSLALAQASGNFRLGTQMEELPGDGVLSALPDRIVRDLSERLKLELKLEQMAAQTKK